MPIPFFGPAQTDAFIPALAWFLVTTVFAVLPVVLAPLLARMRRGRLITIVAIVVAVLAAVPGVLETGHAFATLTTQRALVQTTMAHRYGVAVTSGEAASLLEGGKIKIQGFAHTVRLEAVTPGRYVPVEAGVGPVPAR